MAPQDKDLGSSVLTVTSELFEKVVTAALDGSSLGSAASAFLDDNRDRLIGMSTAAFRALVESLKDVKTADDLVAAKTTYVQNLSYDELLAFQETSAEALATHANSQVRAASFFDAVADVGTRIIPKLLPALLAIL